MTDLTLDQIANAEIVPDMGGPEQWLLRVGEEQYEMVPKNGRNTLLVKDPEVTAAGGTIGVGSMAVHLDFEANTFRLERREAGFEAVRVPDDIEENVLWATYDRDEDRLERLYNELTDGRVRISVMDRFLLRFADAREDGVLETTEDGWLIDDEIIVTWQAENFAVKPDATYSHTDATAFDETKPAREIHFELLGEGTQEVTTANGAHSVTLNKEERRFLATVQYILEDEHGYTHSNGVIGDIVEEAHLSAFTDTRSGLHHGHDKQKHDLRDLSVTDEAIEKLWANSYDHTGVHEMAVRRAEFENAPFDVFEDAPNNDAAKWEKIEDTRDIAPIPQSTKDMLAEMYE